MIDDLLQVKVLTFRPASPVLLQHLRQICPSRMPKVLPCIAAAGLTFRPASTFQATFQHTYHVQDIGQLALSSPPNGSALTNNVEVMVEGKGGQV
ncbi:hypothetical protein N7467_001146 [Penicillium canescens]|nr:hypothetical protein N7467_001146 [Penicillium canescens]